MVELPIGIFFNQYGNTWTNYNGFAHANITTFRKENSIFGKGNYVFFVVVNELVIKLFINTSIRSVPTQFLTIRKLLFTSIVFFSFKENMNKNSLFSLKYLIGHSNLP